MKTNLLFIVLFSLFLIKVLLFAFFVPPWQTPDEPFHIANIENHDQKIRDNISNSLHTFQSLKYIEQEKASVFGENISRKDSLFYNISRAFLSIIPYTNNNLLIRLYSLRSLIVCFSLLIIYFIFHTTKNIITPTSHNIVPLAAASFTGLHPQFSYLTLGVNTDILSFLAISMLTFLITFLLAGDQKIVKSLNAYISNLHKNSTSHQSLFSVLRFCWCKSIFWYHTVIIIAAMIISYACLFIDKETYISIPLLISGLLLLFIVKEKKLIIFRLTQLGIIITIAGLTILALFVFGDTEISIYHKIKGEIYFQLNLFKYAITKLGIPELSFFIRYFGILFISFWFSYGWMVYKMSFGWYFLFMMITIAVVIGLIKLCVSLYMKKFFVRKNNNGIVYQELSQPASVIKPYAAINQITPVLQSVSYSSFAINRKGITLLFLSIIFSFTVLFVKYSPMYDFNMVNARFLLTSMPAISILFVLGIGDLVPIHMRDLAMKGIIIFMLFLNGISIFKYLLPIFYL